MLRLRALSAVVPLLAVACALAIPAAAQAPERPAWARAKSMTILVDSVLLGALPEIRRAMPEWRIAKRGRPALMIRFAARELAPVRRVRPLVVIGIGHNSLWNHGRVGYRQAAARFDAEAERLLRMFRRRGAEQFVWVTLRSCNSANSPGGSFAVSRYCWYFPYVNERLRRLAAKYDDLVLADWTAVSKGSDITYDAIHTTTKGSRLMGRLIRDTVRREAARQARLAP